MGAAAPDLQRLHFLTKVKCGSPHVVVFTVTRKRTLKRYVDRSIPAVSFSASWYLVFWLHVWGLRPFNSFPPNFRVSEVLEKCAHFGNSSKMFSLFWVLFFNSVFPMRFLTNFQKKYRFSISKPDLLVLVGGHLTSLCLDFENMVLPPCPSSGDPQGSLKIHKKKEQKIPDELLFRASECTVQQMGQNSASRAVGKLQRGQRRRSPPHSIVILHLEHVMCLDVTAVPLMTLSFGSCSVPLKFVLFWFIDSVNKFVMK